MTAIRRRWAIVPARFDDVFDEPGSVRALALLRIALGPITLLHLWPDLAATAAGRTYDQHFFVSWWSGLPQPPGVVQTIAVWGAAVGAVALCLGLRTRTAAAATWLGVAVNLALSQHHFRHNRAFLLILLGGVALGDSGRTLSLDARRRHTGDRATVWPLWLLRGLVSSVYFGSGFSKLVDPDWVGGLVLWDRAVQARHLIETSWLPGPMAELVADVATNRAFHSLTSPVIVATELFVAFGLWFRPTRLAAILAAIAFHVSIELTASVEVFSAAGLAALVIWATPSTRDRRVTVGAGRWIRRLDWLARFQVSEVPGAALTVVDRDGTIRTGRDARWLVASRLPVLFPVVAPLRWWWR